MLLCGLYNFIHSCYFRFCMIIYIPYLDGSSRLVHRWEAQPAASDTVFDVCPEKFTEHCSKDTFPSKTR